VGRTVEEPGPGRAARRARLRPAGRGARPGSRPRALLLDVPNAEPVEHATGGRHAQRPRRRSVATTADRRAAPRAVQSVAWTPGFAGRTETFELLQARLPRAFQGPRDDTVVRVDGHVPALGTPRLVLRLLESQLPLLVQRGRLRRDFSLHRQREIELAGDDHAQQQLLDRRIERRPANRPAHLGSARVSPAHTYAQRVSSVVWYLTVIPRPQRPHRRIPVSRARPSRGAPLLGRRAALSRIRCRFFTYVSQPM